MPLLDPSNCATNLYVQLEVSPTKLSATSQKGALQIAPAVNIRLLPPMRFWEDKQRWGGLVLSATRAGSKLTPASITQPKTSLSICTASRGLFSCTVVYVQGWLARKFWCSDMVNLATNSRLNCTNPCDSPPSQPHSTKAPMYASVRLQPSLHLNYLNSSFTFKVISVSCCAHWALEVIWYACFLM